MVPEDEVIALRFLKTTQAYAEARDMQVLNAFNEGEWLQIGKFLGSIVGMLHGQRRKHNKSKRKHTSTSDKDDTSGSTQ